MPQSFLWHLSSAICAYNIKTNARSSSYVFIPRSIKPIQPAVSSPEIISVVFISYSFFFILHIFEW